MEDFDLSKYDKDYDYVIEASAGTGKTYSIKNIVKKLVDGEKIDLDKILIVTYTEKATGELKDGIREILNCDVSSAPIYTIHSFCRNIIKEFGLTADLPSNLTLVDDTEMMEFAHHYVRKGEILKDISRVFSFNLDYDSLFKALKKTKANSIKKSVNGFNVDKIETLLTQLTSKYYLHYSSSKYVEDKNIIQFNQGNHCRELFEAQLNNSTGKSKSKKDWYGFEKLIAGIYLKDFYIQWQQEKEKNKQQSFNDMVRYVREAIKNKPSFKEKLQHKFTYAIIDEFQDTNQQQFDIFHHIFMEDKNHHIIVVGDPKQSIYSFQGTDVEVYNKAVAEIVCNGGKQFRLGKNYRSSHSMVESCNKLFENYNFGITNFDPSDWRKPSDPDGEYQAQFNGKNIKAFWITNYANVIKEGEKLSKDEAARIFAYTSAKLLLDCCQRDENGKTKLQIKPKAKVDYRNVSFHDFTVLARTSSEMQYIQNVFKQIGIPYVRNKDNSLFIGRECTGWIAILQAINATDFTGSNRKTLKKALFTDFFGKSIEEISDQKYEKDDIEEVSKFNQWKNYAFNRQWDNLINHIMNDSGIISRLNQMKDIQSLNMYYQIGNYCIEFLYQNPSLNELIRNLTLKSKGEKNDDGQENVDIVEKGTDFDCVQIMTIHASKGLQFPVVIAACGSKDLNKAGEDVFRCHENDETHLQIKLDNDTEISTHNDETIQELKRLFYVAYTRAQCLMILPDYPSWTGDKSGSSPLGDPLKAFMNANKGSYESIKSISLPDLKQMRQQTEAILKKVQVSTDSFDANAVKKVASEVKDKRSYKHSYSSLSHGTNEQLEDDQQDTEGTNDEGLSRYDKNAKDFEGVYDTSIDVPVQLSEKLKGTSFGTAIHEVFEKWSYDKNDDDQLKKLIMHCFIGQGIKLENNSNPEEDDAEQLVKLVKNVLDADLPIIHGNKKIDGAFKLSSISDEQKLAEVEFSFNKEDEKLKNYFNGFIDLLIKRGEYYSILDWKSDRLNDDFDSYSDPKKLKDHIDSCYSIQRTLYAYCLMKWLKMQYKELSEKEIFQQHFGGVYYVCIRGCTSDKTNGIYCQTWENWDTLKASFEDITKSKIGD